MNNCIDLILFSDASLTVENVIKVMEMVPADRMMVVWRQLSIPQSLVERISRKFLTAKETIQACVDLYLNSSPDHELSWKGIIWVLYFSEEMTAAREAKPFHHQNGKQLFCVEIEEVQCYLLLLHIYIWGT